MVRNVDKLDTLLISSMSSWVGVGVMSGTSLDGLDLCCVEFTGDYNTDTWSHRILKAVTIPYDPEWHQRLQTADDVPGVDLVRMHVHYGRYVGEQVTKFIEENALMPKFIASHGHTIFHQPEGGFTFQLGDGETMAAFLRVPLVANFRNKDVALGGQGAPLVPVGETYLFSQYDMCLNLGGISNISLNDKGFDVCPCNMLLNFLAEKHDESIEFDKDGMIASGGKVIKTILDEMNDLSFYQQLPPKSLGKEWFEEHMLPIIITNNHNAHDLLRTAVEHITDQTINAISQQCSNPADRATQRSMFVTGGGALNNFLMQRMREKLDASDLNITMTESDEDTVQFKEALIFAFLGLRCLLGLPNISSTVTGSSIDSVSGSIHLPPINCPLASNACQDYRFHFRAATVPGYVPPLAKRSTNKTHTTSNDPSGLYYD